VSAEAFIGASGIAETVAAPPAVSNKTARPAIIMRFMLCLPLSRTARPLTQVPDYLFSSESVHQAISSI
jgi:hypothetical protein